MGCQKEIVKQIVARRRRLCDRRQGQPAEAPGGDPEAPSSITWMAELKGLKQYGYHETHEDGHGRIDDRYVLSRGGAGRDFALGEGLALGEGDRLQRCGSRGMPMERETDEVRYYLSSRYLSGQRFGGGRCEAIGGSSRCTGC